MGIWRQSADRKRVASKESYSLFENSDPFDNDDSFLGAFKAPTPTSKSSAQTLRPKTSTFHNYSQTVPVREHADELDADFSSWSKARSIRTWSIYGLVMVLVGISGFTVAKMRPWAVWGSPELVYAYFEVRAVDGAGRPVAGALVKNAGKKVGTTDSFGEWRRYMRVPLGSTVPITISKNGTSDSQSATKNFAVPPTKPEKSDMELRASVQLLPGGSVTSVPSQVAVQAAPAANATGEVKDTKDRDRDREKDKDNTLVGIQETTTTPAEPTKKAADVKTNDSYAEFASSHESIWFDVSGSSPGSLLQRAVLPALVQRAKELGLKVENTSPWHVTLASLVEPPRLIGADGAGLLSISTTDGHTPVAREFLRNYQSDVRATARGILYVLAHHVNKNVAMVQKDGRWVVALPKNSSELWRLAGGMSLASAGHVWLTGVEPYSDADLQGYYLMNAAEAPCGAGKTHCEVKTRSFAEIPAVPTWTRLKLKIVASTKDKDKESVKVFVSGYEARPSGDNVWEYWGQDHGKANVTVIQGGKLLHRLQILNDARQTVAVAAGVAAVSRR